MTDIEKIEHLQKTIDIASNCLKEKQDNIDELKEKLRVLQDEVDELKILAESNK